MATASSTLRRCSAMRSSAVNTPTVGMPSSRAARVARMAISPRLAIRSLRIGTLKTVGVVRLPGLRALPPDLGLDEIVDGTVEDSRRVTGLHVGAQVLD